VKRPATQYTAEVFDQVQLLFDLTGFNDHQLHFLLRFESELDAAVLRKAVISSIEAVPILGTRYVAEGRRPCWQSLDRARFAEAFVVARTQPEFDELVTSRIDESTGPQIKVCLLDSGSPAVALTMNHMAGDAAAFKDYLYLLCRTYTGILADPGYEPVAIAGDRSMRGVLRRFGMGIKLKSLLSHSKENNRSGDHRFPLSEGGDVRPFILTRKLGRESLEAIHGYCTTRGATLNDAVLAAYYRCLFRSLALPCGAELRLPVMVDMRRYLDDGAKSGALANLSSTVITRLELRPEERFADTLARIKAEMDDKKGGDLGLNGFIKLDLVYKLLPDRRANHLLRSRLKSPLICMTNVGILDAARLSLGDQRPRDAFLCGSIKYKPHFQLAMSSYDGELTLSANLYGTAADRERVASFLDDVERELCTACSGPSAATDALAPGGGVCPAEHAGWLATPLRRLLQDPRRILDGLVAAGDTAIDFGCGPGFFTLPMAELVGPGGRVVAVDLQAGMLDRLRLRAERAGLSSRVTLHRCEPDAVGELPVADAALAFWMVHEVPNVTRFLSEVAGALKPGGRFLLVEPRGHVSAAAFAATVGIAAASGLRPVATPRVRLSRTTMFEREQDVRRVQLPS